MTNMKRITGGVIGIILISIVWMAVIAEEVKTKNVDLYKAQNKKLLLNISKNDTLLASLSNSTESNGIQQRPNKSQTKKEMSDINSKKELMEYKNEKIHEIKEIINYTNYPQYPCIVTFNKPVSNSELKQLKEKYRLTVIMVKYKSSRGGGGEMPYSMLEDTKAIEALEFKISESRKRFNKEDNFRLVEGCTAMRVAIPKNETMKLQNDSMVFLVDLGPMELYRGNTTQVKSIKWGDVAYYVAKFND